MRSVSLLLALLLTLAVPARAHAARPDTLVVSSPKWSVALAALDAKGRELHREVPAYLFHDAAGDTDVVVEGPVSGPISSVYAMPAVPATYSLIAVAHVHPWAQGILLPREFPEFPKGGVVEGGPGPEDVRFSEQAQIQQWVTNNGRVFRVNRDASIDGPVALSRLVSASSVIDTTLSSAACPDDVAREFQAAADAQGLGGPVKGAISSASGSMIFDLGPVQFAPAIR